MELGTQLEEPFGTMTETWTKPRPFLRAHQRRAARDRRAPDPNIRLRLQRGQPAVWTRGWEERRQNSCRQRRDPWFPQDPGKVLLRPLCSEGEWEEEGEEGGRSFWGLRVSLGGHCAAVLLGFWDGLAFIHSFWARRRRSPYSFFRAIYAVFHLALLRFFVVSWCCSVPPWLLPYLSRFAPVVVLRQRLEPPTAQA